MTVLALRLYAPSFRTEALCATTPGINWFPDARDNPRAAIALCHECPAERECLAWALAHDERDGIWGGTTEDQRAAMRRKAKAS